MISTGLDAALLKGKRGSQGVAIALNPDGVIAWKAAGCESHTDLGARIMAIRLLLKDQQKRDVGVFIISAYAPVGNAPDDVWDIFFEQLDSCIARKTSNDILVIGTDTNSSMGHAIENDDGPLGNFGLPHVNDSGRRFLSYLSINNLSVMTTAFMKKKYATWIHPRSKKTHQIDHIIVNREMAHRTTDTGVTSPVLDSDHQAVFLKFRVMKRLKKKTEPRQRMINLDYSRLSNPITRTNYCQEVIRNVGTITKPTYTDLTNAVQEASLTSLPKKERAQPKWFQADEKRLLSLIEARNQAMREVFNRRTRSSTERLQWARKALKAAIKDSKDKWIENHCRTLNLHTGTKMAWDSLKALKSGLSKTKRTATRQMKKPDRTICTTSEENAAVFRDHFKLLYEKSPTLDSTVLDSLPQYPIVEGYDHIPSDEELRARHIQIKEQGTR